MLETPRTRMAEKRRKIARRHQKIKMFFASLGITVVSLLFYAGFNFVDSNSNDNLSKNIETVQAVQTIQKNNSNIKNAAVKTSENERINIMLMGVDERDKDAGRSDTLMVASLDSDQDTLSLLSIPRDTRVKINRHGYDKINAAYAYGGRELSKNTVESLLGIDINHYVIVNTHTFVDLIDAIGGIDIDVEKRMKYEDPWDDDGGLVIDLKPGMQHMDGKTAVTYVRYRDEEGDAGRVRRQQHFIRACLDKLSSPSTVMKLPEIINTARKAVKTDLTVGQMIELASTIKNAEENDSGLKTGIVPGYWKYINGVSYLVPDIERLGEVVTDNLGIENENIEEHFEKVAFEYQDSVPFYIDENEFEYDENVNKSKDRRLIERLNEDNFEILENEV